MVCTCTSSGTIFSADVRINGGQLKLSLLKTAYFRLAQISNGTASLSDVTYGDIQQFYDAELDELKYIV